MFIKLKNNHHINKNYFYTKDLHTEYSTEENGKLIGIAYYGIEVFDVSMFYNYIPKKYMKDFIFQHMKINYQIPPHTDSDIKTSLNFYIKTDNCETVFYKPKENVTSFKLDHQTDGNTYFYDDIEKVASFVAHDNEVWLLDVTVPHSVETIETDIYRHALVLQTNVYTFDQVKEILKETNNI